MIFSKFLKSQMNGDRVALFNQLHPTPVFISTKEWKSYQNNHALIPQLLLKELYEKKIIIKQEYDDNELLKQTQDNFLKSNSYPHILYLVLSEGCNFNCEYCPIPQSTNFTIGKQMTIDTAILGIETWEKYLDSNKQHTLILYGGEPLINKSLFFEILTYISQKNIPNLQIYLPTNGYLIDDEVIQACKLHNVIVVVALDGFNKDTNHSRLDNNNNETLTTTLSAINLLQKNNISVACSLTITPHNIDLLDNIINELLKLNISNIGLNILKSPDPYFKNNNDYSEFLKKCSQTLFNCYIKNQPVFVERLTQNKIDAFNNQKFFPSGCTCLGKQMVIMPSNDIVNCPFAKIVIGNLSNARAIPNPIINHPVINNLIHQTPIFNTSSLLNDELALIASPCSYALQHGDSEFSDQHLSKLVFNYLLWHKK